MNRYLLLGTVTAAFAILAWQALRVVLAVPLAPGVTDNPALIGVMLMRQVALNMIAAFLLALVVARLRLPPLRAALTLGTVAFAAGVILELANWNWYGFPLTYVLVNTMDVAFNAAIAGFVLGWFARRLPRSEVAATVRAREAVPA